VCACVRVCVCFVCVRVRACVYVCVYVRMCVSNVGGWLYWIGGLVGGGVWVGR